MKVPYLVDRAHRALQAALLPNDVRRNYGDDLRATFGDLYDTARQQGRLAVCRLLLREAADMWAAGERRWRIPAWRPGAGGLIAADIKYGARSLRRDAALTTFAVLIAGLGIGASSIVFNVFNALFLRPLPFERPGELVWIANGTSDNLSSQTAQVMNLAALATGTGSWSGIAGFSPFYGPGDARLGAGGDVERITAVPITENLLPLLGVRLQIGRGFTPEESQYNGPKAVILSDRFWRRRFRADPAIGGRAITLNDAPATVVGVLAPAFDFAGTFTPGAPADVFVPYPLSPETNRRGNTLALVGRLRPGATLAAAQAEAAVIGARIAKDRAGNRRQNTFDPRLSPLRTRITGTLTAPVAVLVGAVGFLMLIVCANLSSLLLARASARQRDIAVRAALGAERHQLVRQVLVESLMLSVTGGAVGLALAVGGTRLMASLNTAAIPMLYSVSVDVAALAFVVLLTFATGGVFGILPALQASRGEPQHILRDHGRGSIGAHTGTQRAIVVFEIAVVCVLLTGAGLLTRSVMRVLEAERGFDAGSLMMVRVDSYARGTKQAGRNAYFDGVLQQVRSVPGIDAAGLTDALPLGDNYGWRRWSIKRPGQPDGEEHQPLIRMIDEGYLAAMKIPLLAGRGFTTADTEGSEPVAIVNEALAGEMWPGREAVGQTLQIYHTDHRVIALVPPVKYFALERDSGPELYLPLRQAGDYQVVDLVVRSTIPPAALAGNLRAALKRADPVMPAAELRTMDQLIDRSTFPRRSVAWLVAGFGGFGLLLASLGIYAVLSYSVGRRRQEIGLRMALGASPQAVRRGVLVQTMWLALAGLAIGLPASWMLSRAMRGLLFNVEPADAVTFAVAVTVLAVVAAIAGYLPARRASAIDPAVALRAS